MADHKFSDLHCHPAMRPISLQKEDIWDTFKGKLSKVIKAQTQGKRGGAYDQSGYPKLVNSRVKLVYAALYPLEQGFMMNNNIIIGLVNFASRVLPVPALFRWIFGIDQHLRDYLLSMYAKFPVKKIKKLKKQEYWDGFREEFMLYRNSNDSTTNLFDKSKDEITALLKHAYEDQAPDLKVSGKYVFVDETWDETLPTGDDILTVMTMEGMAIVSQTKEDGGNSKHGTKLLDEQTIMNRFEFLKINTPVFFVTFSHHFSSGLCGHARSFPDISRNLGLLNQEYFISENFSRIGYKALQYLLSVKLENGQWVKDDDARRRILIDVKHMSLRGRLSLYQLVRGFNSSHGEEDRIPIVASHVGFSNKTIAQMLHRLNTTGETTKTQIQKTDIAGREHTFNTWSINLGVEEIGYIVESGGLIGISLEQNNLGIAFGQKTDKEDEEFFGQLVMNQILSMAKAANTEDFWSHVTMGTDFDGIIDPVDHYSSTLFFDKLRTDLIREFNTISDDEWSEACMPGKAIEEILDDLFFKNAFKFLQKHYKREGMPEFKKPQP